MVKNEKHDYQENKIIIRVFSRSRIQAPLDSNNPKCDIGKQIIYPQKKKIKSKRVTGYTIPNFFSVLVVPALPYWLQS